MSTSEWVAASLQRGSVRLQRASSTWMLLREAQRQCRDPLRHLAVTSPASAVIFAGRFRVEVCALRETMYQRLHREFTSSTFEGKSVYLQWHDGESCLGCGKSHEFSFSFLVSSASRAQESVFWSVFGQAALVVCAWAGVELCELSVMLTPGSPAATPSAATSVAVPNIYDLVGEEDA